MALNAERYSFMFETRGTARLVNASSLMVMVDGEHWLVGVARNLLRPVGRSFQLTHTQYTEHYAGRLQTGKARQPWF